MATYSVHARSDEPLDQVSGVVFVRSGFLPSALIFGGFWFFWHRMWLVLAGYVGLLAMLAGAVLLIGLHPAGAIVLQSLVAFAVGLEASGLRRWHVERAGYHEVAGVSGRNRDDAEMRYFAHAT